MSDIHILYDIPAGEVAWPFLIIMEIFFNGLSTGLFLVTVTGYLYRVKRIEPLVRIGAVLAPVLIIVTLLLVVSDLLQPTRAISTFYRSNILSPMSWAVYVLVIYLTNAVVFAWFVFRRDMAALSLRSTTIGRKGFYAILALGIMGRSKRDLARDRWYARFFAVVGIPLALMAHGYTGMLFTVVGTRDMWNTTLMPLFFLLAAVVSGAALGMVVLTLYRRLYPDRAVEARKTILYLGRVMAVVLSGMTSFYAIQFVALSFGSPESWAAIWLLTSGPLGPTFVGAEVIMGALLPLVLVIHPRTGRSLFGNVTAAVLAIMGVLMVRYNTVLGGQMLPMRGSELLEFNITLQDMLSFTGVFLLGLLLAYTAFMILPLHPLSATGDIGPKPRNGNSGDSGTGRRSFVRNAAAALLALAVGARLATDLRASAAADRVYEDTGRKRYAMVIDLRKCIGCHSCTQACKREFKLPPGVWRSWVVKVQAGNSIFFLPRLCNHCENTPCLRVCPVRATYKAEGGFILQRYDKCIGCKYCVLTCPYGMRFVHPEIKVVDKCSFCYHRVKKGLLPACVVACPVGARIFGDRNDPGSDVRKVLDTTPSQVLKPEKNTQPQVFYINADLAAMRPALIPRHG